MTSETITYTNTVAGHSYTYLFDTKVRANFELYCKFKSKYDFDLSEAEIATLTEQVQAYVNTQLGDIQSVVIPSTTNSLFLNIVKTLGKKVFVLEKNDNASIKKELDQQAMMRTERQKLYAAIDSMDTIKMAAIAGNQRKRFINCLFKKCPVENAAFLDDSVFSGCTLTASLAAIEHPTLKNIVLFSK